MLNSLIGVLGCLQGVLVVCRSRYASRVVGHVNKINTSDGRPTFTFEHLLPS